MIRHRRSLPLLLLAVVAIVSFAAGCDLPPDLNCTPESGPRLVVRGNSLGAMSESIAQPAIHAEHTAGSTCYTAKAGSQINEHGPALPQLDTEDCVIMELGTNDINNELFEQTKTDLHAAAGQLADTGRQIWFTLNTTGGDLRGFPYDRRTRWFNEELLAMDADDARWPNLVVWRWDLESAGHTEWLNLPDKIHYNGEGTQRFGESLIAAARSCPFPTLSTTTTAGSSTTTLSPAATASALVAA